MGIISYSLFKKKKKKKTAHQQYKTYVYDYQWKIWFLPKFSKLVLEAFNKQPIP